MTSVAALIGGRLPLQAWVYFVSCMLSFAGCESPPEVTRPEDLNAKPELVSLRGNGGEDLPIVHVRDGYFRLENMVLGVGMWLSRDPLQPESERLYVALVPEDSTSALHLDCELVRVGITTSEEPDEYSWHQPARSEDSIQAEQAVSLSAGSGRSCYFDLNLPPYQPGYLVEIPFEIDGAAYTLGVELVSQHNPPQWAPFTIPESERDPEHERMKQSLDRSFFLEMINLSATGTLVSPVLLLMLGVVFAWRSGRRGHDSAGIKDYLYAVHPQVIASVCGVLCLLGGSNVLSLSMPFEVQDIFLQLLSLALFISGVCLSLLCNWWAFRWFGSPEAAELLGFQQKTLRQLLWTELKERSPLIPYLRLYFLMIFPFVWARVVILAYLFWP